MRKTRAFYERILSSSPCGYALHKIIADDSGRPVDFVIVECNAAFEKMARLGSDPLAGKKISDLVPGPESRKRFLIERFGAVALNGGKDAFEVHSEFDDSWHRVEAFRPRKGFCVALISPANSRKTIAHAVGKIEDALKSIADIPTIQICLWMPDTTLTFVNEGYAAAYGRTPADLIGTKWIDLVPQGSRIEVAETYKRLVAAPRSHSYEQEAIAPDGSSRWILWTDLPEFEKSGRLVQFLSLGQDITDLKIIREALVKEAEINAEMARLSERLIFSNSIQSAADMCLESAKKLTGSPNGFVGYTDQTTGRFISPTMKNPVPPVYMKHGIPFDTSEGLIGRVLKSHTAILNNNACLGQDSKEFPEGHISVGRFLSAPAVSGETLVGKIVVANAGRDYTENDMRILERLASIFSLGVRRQEALNALRESEKKWRSLVENAPDAICVHSEGRIVYVNPKTLSLFGQPSADSLIGKSIVDYVHPEYRQGVQERLHHLNLDRTPVPVLEQVFLKLDGTPVEVEASSMPIDYEGRPCALTFIRDISQRKLAERALKCSLHEKEVLLQEIHHRVKNNLQVVSSLLSIQAKSLGDEKTAHVFREIQNRIRSMALIHEKLYLSGNLAKVDFADYIKGLVSHLLYAQTADSRRISVRYDTEEILLDINTAIPCGLLLNELISNSIGHAFPGNRSGELFISLCRIDEGRVRLAIKDNGIGFPKDLDFRKTESLGLQLVMMLVGQIGGSIELVSEGGTEFRLTFSIAVEHADT